MSRKTFEHIKLIQSIAKKNLSTETHVTAEGIAIQKNYTKKDFDLLRHVNFAAGISPNLRGPIARCM